MGGKSYSDDDLLLLLERKDQGATFVEIAEEMGRNVKSLSAKWHEVEGDYAASTFEHIADVAAPLVERVIAANGWKS